MIIKNVCILQIRVVHAVIYHHNQRSQSMSILYVKALVACLLTVKLGS